MLSRSWSSSFLAVLTVTLFTYSSAYAGAGSGGGGDFRCAEYSDLVNRIAASLVELGQVKVREVSSTIQIDDMSKVSKNIVCLPVTQLDRQARSYRADGHTDLLVSNWEVLGRNEKVRLTAHEMSVLAGYEKDGQYRVSNELLELLRKSPRSLFRSEQMDVSSVAGKGNEIESQRYTAVVGNTFTRRLFETRVYIKLRGQYVVSFQVRNDTEADQMIHYLTILSLNTKNDQLIRITLSKIPSEATQIPAKGFVTLEEFKSFFQIENDL